jgi:hypothetical protein
VKTTPFLLNPHSHCPPFPPFFLPGLLAPALSLQVAPLPSPVNARLDQTLLAYSCRPMLLRSRCCPSTPLLTLLPIADPTRAAVAAPALAACVTASGQRLLPPSLDHARFAASRRPCSSYRRRPCYSCRPSLLRVSAPFSRPCSSCRTGPNRHCPSRPSSSCRAGQNQRRRVWRGSKRWWWLRDGSGMPSGEAGGSADRRDGGGDCLT